MAANFQTDSPVDKFHISCYSRHNNFKIYEQNEYLQQRHYREPEMLRTGVICGKEWIWEMQGERGFFH